jgi:hypothetical protein
MISTVTLSIDIPPKSLICYVRNNRGERIGVFVAKKFEPYFSTGFSKCRKNEPFNKVIGLNNAFIRADVGIVLDSYEVPHSMRRAYKKFLERCNKYYQV